MSTSIFQTGQKNDTSVVTGNVTTGAQLISIIKQVVGQGGMELNQSRLAEILIKIVSLISAGGGGASTIVLSFDQSTNTISADVDGNTDSEVLNETHGTFTGSTIPDGVTTKVALQSLETALEALTLVAINGAENGLTISGGKVRLGGTNKLLVDTTIDGDNLFSLIFTKLKSFLVDTDLTGGTSKMSMGLTNGIALPAFIKAAVVADPTQYALLQIDADGSLTSLAQVKGTDTAGIFMPSEKIAQLIATVGGVTKMFSVEDGKHYAKGIAAKAAQTKVVFIDPTTGECGYGDAAAALQEYDATDGVRVLATGTGITADWASGELTITIPANVQLISFRLAQSNGANVQAAADAGGATNWIRVKIVGTVGYNTSAADMKVPSVQKCFYAAGAPGLGNAYSIDVDNNPNVAVVGVGSNSITIRIWNLTIPDGAQFTFNGI